MLESLFNKVAGLYNYNLIKNGCFLWNLQNFLEHFSSQNIPGGCFWRTQGRDLSANPRNSTLLFIKRWWNFIYSRGKGFAVLFWYVAHFFIRTSKISMRLNVLIFWRILASKCSYFVLIFYETFLPVNGDNY